MVTQESGRKVPIVQAYAFTKYLGKIDVEFDEKGEVVEAKGNPILLNYEIKEDPEVVESLKEWQLQLNDSLQHPIGKTRVVLEGRRCRFEECNLGSVMADSFIYHVRYRPAHRRSLQKHCKTDLILGFRLCRIIQVRTGRMWPLHCSREEVSEHQSM